MKKMLAILAMIFLLLICVSGAVGEMGQDADSAPYGRGTQGGWKKVRQNPLLGGKLGTCFDIAMLEDDGELKMYFSRREKKNISVTTSKNGIRWENPTTCISPRAVEEGKEDDLNRPSVVKVGSIYHMWYTGQYKAGQHDGTSDIFHAVSEDGIHFTRTGDNPVLSPEFPWEKQAVMCPSVIWDEENQKFKMWYSAGEQVEPNAIGYAESTDGLVWTKSDLNPIFQADPTSSWEQHKVTGCHVFWHDGWYRMFYIGFYNEGYAQIGMARSRDGITNWERSDLNPIISPDEGKWDGDACYKPYVMKVDGDWMLWYNGRNGSKEQIGCAVLKGEELVF